MIVTSNRAFEEWADVFGDNLLASAALDRLTHHAHTLIIRGASYRQRTHTKERANYPSAVPQDPPPRVTSEPDSLTRRVAYIKAIMGGSMRAAIDKRRTSRPPATGPGCPTYAMERADPTGSGAGADRARGCHAGNRADQADFFEIMLGRKTIALPKSRTVEGNRNSPIVNALTADIAIMPAAAKASLRRGWGGGLDWEPTARRAIQWNSTERSPITQYPPPTATSPSTPRSDGTGSVPVNQPLTPKYAPYTKRRARQVHPALTNTSTRAIL